LLVQSFFIYQDKPSLKNGENVAFGDEHWTGGSLTYKVQVLRDT
jgi:hypothetical protein